MKTVGATNATQADETKLSNKEFLDENVCDLCQVDKVAVQNLLSCGKLNTTRKTSPRSSSVNSV